MAKSFNKSNKSKSTSAAKLAVTPKKRTLPAAKTASKSAVASKPKKSTVKFTTKKMKLLSENDLRGKIAERAYFIYLERGYCDGQQDAHWLQAETEVLAELQTS